MGTDLRLLFILPDLKSVYLNGAVFRVSVHTAHTVVADFFRIQIASVAFSAADAFPVIQYTHFMQRHDESLLGMNLKSIIFPYGKEGQALDITLRPCNKTYELKLTMKEDLP